MDISSNATNSRMRSRAEASTNIPSSDARRSTWYSPARRPGAAGGESPASRPTSGAQRNRRLAKIARPSRTNMAPGAGGTGGTSRLSTPTAPTPAVATSATHRRSAPRAQRFRTNTARSTSPRPISRLPARSRSGDITLRPHDPAEEGHGGGVHRRQGEPGHHPEQHEHGRQDDERNPLGPARVLEVGEVGRGRPPEDLLGDAQHVDGRQERAGHRREEPPDVVRAPGAHERQQLGHEARRRRQAERGEAGDR